VTLEQTVGKIHCVEYAPAITAREIFEDEPLVDTDATVDVPLLIVEHVPDNLFWLKGIAEALRDDGVLSLLIPGNRYPFEYIREMSSPGKLISPGLPSTKFQDHARSSMTTPWHATSTRLMPDVAM
jgi:hypothetical protein